MARIAALLFLFMIVGNAEVARGDTRRGWVTLEWTAPGDDGFLGDAALYDIRYSEDPITEDSFGLAERALVKRASPVGTRELCRVDGLQPGRDYYFAVRTQDPEGNWSAISNPTVFSGRAIISEPIDEPVVPLGTLPPLDFSAAAPNPAHHSVHFNISLPSATLVRVDVFDAAGRRVRVLVASVQPAGVNRVDWDLRDTYGTPIGPGVYLVRAQIEGKAWTRRVTVID